MGKGRSYMNSYADGYMRGKVVKEVGALLDHMIVEEITTPTIINLEFGSAYDTIRKLRQQETSISFEVIRQFCYVIGYYLYQEIQAVENYKKNVRDREARLAMLYEMKEKYKKILRNASRSGSQPHASGKVFAGFNEVNISVISCLAMC